MSDTQTQPTTRGKKRTASDASLADKQPRARPQPVMPGTAPVTVTVTSSDASVQLSDDEPGSPMDGVQTMPPLTEVTVTIPDPDSTLERGVSSGKPIPAERTEKAGFSMVRANDRRDTPLQDGQSPPLPELTDAEREAMREIDPSRDDGAEDSEATVDAGSRKTSRAAKVQANEKILHSSGFTPVNKSQGKGKRANKKQITANSNDGKDNSSDTDYQPPPHSFQDGGPHTPATSPSAAEGSTSTAKSEGGRKMKNAKSQRKDRNPAHDEANIYIYTLRQQGKDFDTIAKEMNEEFPLSNGGRFWTRAACDGRFRRNGEYVARERGERWNRDWYMHMKEPVLQSKIKPVEEGPAAGETRGENGRNGSGDSTTDEEDLGDESDASPRGEEGLDSAKGGVAVLLGLLGEKIDEGVQDACNRRMGVEKSVEQLKAMLAELACTKG
ncbi:hypothetical protein K431DRAFT_283142 [Polychaeton citri CBS 116435]|uniref:Uncharacterized protein n=1 Tax=Polychaeton citri CBS 116435 TaxID=1314669 RepID=A0A9P4QE99_9PEZI|nr:hypothetical protein K431DRAFT_283142 [Polychaeton citri CBS 116435]